MKPSTNSSGVLKNPAENRNSSRRSVLLIILLIIFIIGVIGSAIFFVLRSRQNGDKLVFDQISSDEISVADADETETNGSNDSEVSAGLPTEIPSRNEIRKGGQTFTQYDQEEM